MVKFERFSCEKHPKKIYMGQFHRFSCEKQPKKELPNDRKNVTNCPYKVTKEPAAVLPTERLPTD